jgi:hypothetical protein
MLVQSLEQLRLQRPLVQDRDLVKIVLDDLLFLSELEPVIKSGVASKRVGLFPQDCLLGLELLPQDFGLKQTIKACAEMNLIPGQTHVLDQVAMVDVLVAVPAQALQTLRQQRLPVEVVSGLSGEVLLFAACRVIPQGLEDSPC